MYQYLFFNNSPTKKVNQIKQMITSHFRFLNNLVYIQRWRIRIDNVKNFTLYEHDNYDLTYLKKMPYTSAYGIITIRFFI